MIDYTVLHDPQTLGINKEKPHCYYHPETVAGDSESHSLNGDWGFKYFDSGETVSFPTILRDWKLDQGGKISVPGNWQLSGFGRPHYTNIQYPFPINPPYTFENNPMGVYRRKIRIPKKYVDQQTFIRFDGVDNCFFLWINGQRVGFSKGSRNLVEFNISSFLNDDQNDIAVQVFQWSDSSYIEDQDMWWLSGIFRDVTIITRPSNFVVDYQVDTKIDFDKRIGILNIQLASYFPEKLNVEVDLIDSDGNVISQNIRMLAGLGVAEFRVDDVELWNCDTPNLYKVVIRTSEEIIKQPFGFREIEIIHGEIKVNQFPILLKGVNYHEFDSEHGRYVPRETLEKDLLLMKSAHINAIRCSHYPHQPLFYELCDQYGFYVMDEADLECHGIGSTGDKNFLSSDSIWLPAYRDRMQQMIEHNKNFTCILFWSVGNESGNGINQAEMVAWGKKRDSSRLYHHEGESRDCFDSETDRYFKDVVIADFNSRMYATVDELNDVGQNPQIKKPYILCEYGHAMGNGPGSLQEYLQLFRQYPKLSGGFIWEWKEHGIIKNRNGRKTFLYGGDFGDHPNDGNFVLDGIVQSDLTLTPSYFDVAHVYAPYTIKKLKNSSNEFEIYKRDRHCQLLEPLIINYSYQDDLGEISSGSLAIDDIDFDHRTTFRIPQLANSRNTCVLKVDLIIKDSSGHNELPITTSTLYHKNPSVQQPDDRKFENIRQSSQELVLTLAGNGSREFLVDLSKGNWQLLDKNSHRIIGQHGRSVFWRPMTNNDFISEEQWRKAGVDALARQFHRIQIVSVTTEKVVIELTEVYGAPGKYWRIQVTNRVSLLPDGSVIYAVEGEPQGEFSRTIPRIGHEFVLSKGYRRVDWLGLGPRESYPDAMNGTYLNFFSFKINEAFFNYSYPQESGNHMETYWSKVSGPNLPTIIFSNESRFNFSVKSHPIQEIDHAKHIDELSLLPHDTYFYLDLQQHGIGSRSCGPDVLNRYKLFLKPYHYEFKIVFGLSDQENE
ncbi:glycoside hydrolase family 2 TIM barrel-domain containing protein [Lapidilactobacillus luobeiensis]|uniref:glycoside hydrolase family 2 TIM barrel-domain containing protein n=1 Tax=Lapidilactobacillus luobeiensis TaxID=2950371 RepID=UPI0021C4414A|nr:glycoside hydrolase family 2 TIM barrel-domain containing protein [Lapidilactobacillus luobeiensis]